MQKFINKIGVIFIILLLEQFILFTLSMRNNHSMLHTFDIVIIVPSYTIATISSIKGEKSNCQINVNNINQIII